MRLSLLLSLACLAAGITGGVCDAGGKMIVYIGGRAKKGGGIHRYSFDVAKGTPAPLGVTDAVPNPSFIAIHPSRKYLYAVNELYKMGKKRTGAVSAFAIDPKTGDLTLLNQQETGGAGPCYVAVDAAGKNALAANYGGGSVCVLPIGPDGRLGPRTAFVQHEGKGVDPKRQAGPHAHSINLDPANRFAFAADLGLDKLLVYRFDPAKGTLEPNDPPFAAVAPGAGPRHFAFHPSGKTAYVINELNSTITVFDYAADRGVLAAKQSIPTLPAGAEGDNSTAEVLVHPTGKFLYGSNRGHNSLVVYAIDPADGTLSLVEHESVRGDWPRNFRIDPTGAWLLVANRRTSNVVVFAIDGATGALTATGHSIDVPDPVCIRMMPAP